MIKRNTGHIVTIASAAGHMGTSGLVDYCASKFGAVGFNESLRQEFKSKGYSNLKLNKVILLDIKTTCICPYLIETGMFRGVGKTKLSFFIPNLKPEYVANRVIAAIR